MSLLELGVCATSRCGQKYVWAYLDPLGTVTHVHVGITNHLHKASGELSKLLCENMYPGIWRIIEEKVLQETEMDDGI